MTLTALEPFRAWLYQVSRNSCCISKPVTKLFRSDWMMENVSARWPGQRTYQGTLERIVVLAAHALTFTHKPTLSNTFTHTLFASLNSAFYKRIKRSGEPTRKMGALAHFDGYFSSCPKSWLIGNPTRNGLDARVSVSKERISWLQVKLKPRKCFENRRRPAYLHLQAQTLSGISR
jgi:hypothetical protein